MGKRKQVTSSTLKVAKEYKKKLRSIQEGSCSENSVHPPSPSRKTVTAKRKRSKPKKVTSSAQHVVRDYKKKLRNITSGVEENPEAENPEATQPITTSAGNVAIVPFTVETEPVHPAEGSPAKVNTVRALVFKSPAASIRHSQSVEDSEEETNSPNQAPVEDGNDGNVSDRISASAAGLFVMRTPDPRIENADGGREKEVVMVNRLPTPRERGPISDEDFQETLNSEQERQMDEILRTGKVPECSEMMDVGGPSGLGGADEEPVVDNDKQSESDQEGEEEEEEEGDDLDEVHEDDGNVVYKKDDKPWKLVEAVEGGPQEVELLRGFLSHVAYHIWNGEDRGLLSAKKSYECMIDTWIPDLSKKPQVAALVENLEVFDLKNLMHKRVDMVTVSAFVERWHPETNSFHFPWGEVTLTLHDIGYLSGLPIVGKLPFEKWDTKTLHVKFADLLGCTKALVAKNWKSGCLRYSFIKAQMKNGRGCAEKVAKVYVMWLLSATLFADKSKFGLLGDLLPYVDKLEEVDSYNWAAAALVNLYRQLGVASRNDCSMISGCLTFLQGWIWAYFPCFRPEKENKNWDSDKPWVLKWAPKCFHPNLEGLMKCRGILDGLTVDKVNWTPFDANPAQQHPSSAFHGVLQFRQIKEPYMPDRVMRQFGYVQTIPDGVYHPVKEIRSKPNQYVAEYTFSPDAFRLIRQHCVRFEGATRVTKVGEVAEDYLEWFVPRTHPYVLPPCASASPKGDGLKEQLGLVFDLVKDMHRDARDANVDKEQLGLVIDRIYDVLKPRFHNEKDSGAAGEKSVRKIRKGKKRDDDDDREM